MARIRTIKPDFFTSESVGALSLHARLTFAGLWTYVDDKGRAKDNVRAIRGALWPNDEETVNSTDVARFIDELVKHGMVCRYTHEGSAYLHAINFNKHQAVNKPTPSKLPECPVHDGGAVPTTPVILPEGSDTTPGELPEDYRGEGNGSGSGSGSGSGTLLPTAAIQPPLLTVVPTEPLAALARTRSEQFDAFWDVYPRSVGKDKARKAFEAALKRGASFDAILAAACSYAERCGLTRQDTKFIPHPTTWLNRGSWSDDLDASLPLQATGTGGHTPYQNRTDPNAYEHGDL